MSQAQEKTYLQVIHNQRSVLTFRNYSRILLIFKLGITIFWKCEDKGRTP